MKPNSRYLTRQEKLQTILQNTDLDALILNPGPSLTYLTNLHFHLSERPVLVGFLPDETSFIILPELEIAKVRGLDFPLKSYAYQEDPKSWVDFFQMAMKNAGLASGKIGIESLGLRFLEVNLIRDAIPNSELVLADDVISTLRMYKDEAEISYMQNAVDIAQEALLATLPIIKTGITEEEISRELSIQLIRHGSNPNLPFFPIVSSGPNSANPHASPSQRQLQQGDLLVIDYGANVNGYVSDITRTFAIGQVDQKYHEIAQVVLDANQVGREIVKPGITAGAVDDAARSVIEDAGYGSYFIHRTGHGIGLEGHEPPYIRSGNLVVLDPGMSFTIEPGIYLPNENGVRIEDNVVVTRDGNKTLTNLPRELITLPS